MAKFKVGDRARLVKVREGAISPFPPGIVVHIVGALVGTTDDGLPYEYQIDTAPTTDGDARCVMGWQLEPLTPDIGSWEEIERLTKWKPQGVTA